MKRVVIASNNPGKLREIGRILEPLAFQAVAQSELGVPEVAEPFGTFIENALVKARHASMHANLPALADDSGICVDALGGSPGVYSARYAGQPTSDARNNARLLAELEPFSDRRAHYYCVIVFLRHPEDPEPLIAEGIWHGEILREYRGEGGFGYDPLFLIPELGKTGAEIPLDEKNKISHRGQALQVLRAKMQQRGFLGEE